MTARGLHLRMAMAAPLRQLALVWALLLGLVLLSGCANQAPVRTFADETKKLSAAFDPMLSGATGSCMDKYQRKKLLTSRNFDPEAVQSSAKELCVPLEADNRVMADLNALLEQYADTLLALADDKLASYKTELNGLQSSLGQVKLPGSTAALVNANTLGSITSLTEFLSRIATQHLQKAALRDLLDHEAAVNAITAALGDYARLNYKAWLGDERREIAILRKALDASTASEPLAANYLKTILLAEERQVQARERAADAFVTSVSALQKSNAALRASFDHVGNEELLHQLLGFAREVSALRKQVRDAF